MAEIVDDNAAALEDLLSVADEPLLGFPALKVGGNPVAGIVTELTLDEIIVAGGIGERGGFTAVVRRADFPAGVPKYTAIEARGMALEVLSVASHVAHFVLTAGDPVETE